MHLTLHLHLTRSRFVAVLSKGSCKHLEATMCACEISRPCITCSIILYIPVCTEVYIYNPTESLRVDPACCTGQLVSNRRWASIGFCDACDMSRYSASFPPSPPLHIFRKQYMPCVTSQQGPFLDKVGHWGVPPFAGFQLFSSIHFFSNFLERLPTVYAVVYMHTNPYSSMSHEEQSYLADM